MNFNKVYNMDVIDFLNNLSDCSVDLIIADPPYNISIDKWDTFKNNNSYYDFIQKWFDLSIEKLKHGGTIYIFNTPFNNAILLSRLIDRTDLTIQNWITWYKKDGFSNKKKSYINNQETILFITKNGSDHTFNRDLIREPYLSDSRIIHASKKGILKNGKRWFPNPNGRLATDVWEFSSDRHNKKMNGKTQSFIHPTPKPEKIIQRMILASSNENDLVLDLFSGSGTTSFISKKLNRFFLGCELDKKYYKYILERLKNE